MRVLQVFGLGFAIYSRKSGCYFFWGTYGIEDTDCLQKHQVEKMA